MEFDGKREYLDRCPLEILDHATADLIRAARWAKRGILPVAGGWLDQARVFVEGVEAVWQEESRYNQGASFLDLV